MPSTLHAPACSHSPPAQTAATLLAAMPAPEASSREAELQAKLDAANQSRKDLRAQIGKRTGAEAELDDVAMLREAERLDALPLEQI